MSTWKRLASRPAGALPDNIVGKLGVALITVLLLALFLSVLLTSNEPEDAVGDDTADTQQPLVDPGRAQGLRNQIEQEQRQQQYQQDEERRAADQQRLRDETLRMGAVGQLTEPGGPPPVDPETGEPLTLEEHELRQAIRLEELERQLRSLRTSPVAQSHRAAEGAPEPSGTGVQPPAAPPTPTGARDDVPLGPEALPGADPSGYTPTPGSLDVPLPNAANLPDYDNQPRFATPRDPPGWERIFEGSFVEAVLVTQLSGDFPSPVLATAAVPFYSADRQRVLIPRGSRFIGTAQPVRGQDQERLAVGFHRVILPDGTHVALQFQGLNQMGEGALKDQVDRHYFSTFLAAGAVGLMSGFAAIGGNPYAGGLAGYRSGVAQGTSESGLQVMRRFLNRLPTVTIRAGHRLRIWFTSDALFPSRRRSLP